MKIPARGLDSIDETYLIKACGVHNYCMIKIEVTTFVSLVIITPC